MYRSITRLISMIVFAASMAACQLPSGSVPFEEFAPAEDQTKAREEKPVTIGVPLTVPYNMPSQITYRPNGDWSVGTTVMGTYDDESDRQRLDNAMEASGTHQTSELFMRYFPKEKSGFYVGAGAAAVSGQVDIYPEDGPADSSQDLSALYEAEYKAFYAGPAYGFVWQWDNGLTLGMDISTRKRFQHDVDFTYNRQPVSERVETAIVNQYIPKTTHGTVTIGYSF